MKPSRMLIAVAFAASPISQVNADTASTLAKFVGYTIVASKTVDAYGDKGKGKKDGFEGCDFDRIIVFTDGTGVVCKTYSYTYSYRPDAVILAKQFSYQGKQFVTLKLVVGGDVYDVEAP